MAPKRGVRVGVSADDEIRPYEGAIRPEDDSGAVEQHSEEESEDEVRELKRMFQRFMQDQQDRDTRQLQEAARQETRWKSLQHQFRLFQGEVSQRTSLEDLQDRGVAEPEESPRASTGSRNVNHGYALKEPKMQPLCDSDEIEHYLTTFERIAEVCRWPREDWAIRLIPLLTGKARSAYVAMDVTDASDYRHVKEAILTKYSINHETYRQRFRAMEVLEEETPKELYVRLKDLYQKWVRPAERSKQEIGEMIILEQFLRMLSPELQTWIKEHGPSTAEEAARLADVFVAARRRTESWSFTHWRTAQDRSSRRQIPTSQGISNSTGTNSSDLNGVGLKPALSGEVTPIAQARIHSRKPRAGEESGSGKETPTTAATAISVDSAEREHLIDLPIDGIAARLPTLAEPQTRGFSQLDFSKEGIEDGAPRWKSEKLQADGTLFDMVTIPPPPEFTHSQPEEIITVNFYNPSHEQHVVHDPSAWAQKLQGGDPTSWTLSDFYDYLSPDYSPTEVYLEESQPTPPDMEDENVPLVASVVPSNTRVFTPDDGGSGETGVSGMLGKSGCLLGFVRINSTCVSPCDVFTSYCFNGGQCYVVDGIGAFCRCNIQEYMWNKGSRCESIISDFQVMCIAVGGATIMLLLLFMIIVFFSKRLHMLKTENRKLRKHSKCRPKSEQHVDNFSLSTVAEGSQANDDTCKEEPCKKEDESLNNQNSFTPKLENDKAATEDNAEEVNSLQNNMNV